MPIDNLRGQKTERQKIKSTAIPAEEYVGDLITIESAYSLIQGFKVSIFEV